MPWKNPTSCPSQVGWNILWIQSLLQLPYPPYPHLQHHNNTIQVHHGHRGRKCGLTSSGHEPNARKTPGIIHYQPLLTTTKPLLVSTYSKPLTTTQDVFGIIIQWDKIKEWCRNHPGLIQGIDRKLSVFTFQIPKKSRASGGSCEMSESILQSPSESIKSNRTYELCGPQLTADHHPFVLSGSKTAGGRKKCVPFTVSMEVATL